MKVKQAYRYELKPSSATRILLAKHAGAARFTYNWGLAQRKALYEKDKKSTNAIEQHRVLNELKSKEFPWMYEVSKCAPQEALRDLNQAFNRFFKGIREGKKIGFPKFKKKGRRDSFRLTGAIKIKDKKIRLPRLGIIGLKEKSKVQGRILSATIAREADRWYVCLTVETERKDPIPVEGEKVGVDLGINCFAALSSGEKIFSPKPLNKNLQRLKRLSRQHSRKKLGSKNKKKLAFKLARLHRKIKNIRQDFLHKQSTKLAKTKSVIILEDLCVQGMQRGYLSRQISDAGWGNFRRMLEYKAKWYGSLVILRPRFFASTKLCSQCNFKVAKLPLNIREWQCENCHSIHDRDINAALNLLKFNTESSSGIYACEDSSNGVSKKLTSYGSLKQEINNSHI